MVGIAILISMVYASAVDSMSNTDIVFYLIPIVAIWWIVKLLNEKIKSETKK